MSVTSRATSWQIVVKSRLEKSPVTTFYRAKHFFNKLTPLKSRSRKCDFWKKNQSKFYVTGQIKLTAQTFFWENEPYINPMVMRTIFLWILMILYILFDVFFGFKYFTNKLYLNQLKPHFESMHGLYYYIILLYIPWWIWWAPTTSDGPLDLRGDENHQQNWRIAKFTVHPGLLINISPVLPLPPSLSLKHTRLNSGNL